MLRIDGKHEILMPDLTSQYETCYCVAFLFVNWVFQKILMNWWFGCCMY